MSSEISFTISHAAYESRFHHQAGLFVTNYTELLSLLADVKESKNLPDHYENKVLNPFIRFLSTIGKEEFDRLMQDDLGALPSSDRKLRRYIIAVGEALLLYCHEGKYCEEDYHTLLAFQSVIDSFYNRILDAKVKGIGQDLIPAMAKWGKDRGPHTFTASISRGGNALSIGIVSLPPGMQNGSILGWTALAHEVAGHNFLNQFLLLNEQIGKAIRDALKKEGIPDELAVYLERCTEETTSDILGLLNIGPIFAMGLIAYFRSINHNNLMQTTGPYYSTHQKGNSVNLQSESPHFNDRDVTKIPDYVGVPNHSGVLGSYEGREVRFTPYKEKSGHHPIQAVRPYLLAHVVELLTITSRQTWKNAILKENEKELSRVEEFSLPEIIKIDGKIAKHMHTFPKDLMLHSARIVARAIATTPLDKLGGKCFIDLFQWSDRDEAIVAEFKHEGLHKDNPDFVPDGVDKNLLYARYVVAAATQAAIEPGNHPKHLFSTMKKMLVVTHQRAKPWTTPHHQFMADQAGPADDKLIEYE